MFPKVNKFGLEDSFLSSIAKHSLEFDLYPLPFKEYSTVLYTMRTACVVTHKLKCCL